jgi:hypothetical protein
MSIKEWVDLVVVHCRLLRYGMCRCTLQSVGYTAPLWIVSTQEGSPSGASGGAGAVPMASPGSSPLPVPVLSPAPPPRKAPHAHSTHGSGAAGASGAAASANSNHSNSHHHHGHGHSSTSGPTIQPISAASSSSASSRQGPIIMFVWNAVILVHLRAHLALAASTPASSLAQRAAVSLTLHTEASGSGLDVARRRLGCVNRT